MGRLSILFLVLIFITGFTTGVQAQKTKKNKNQEHSERDYRDAEYWFAEGQKYYILEDFAKARAFFQRSLDIIPDNATVHYKLAEVLSKGDGEEKINEALIEINKAIELEDNNPYFYLLAADLYTRKGNFTEAARMYEILIEKVSGSERYYFELAGIYIYQGKFDNALETYDRLEQQIGINEQTSYQKQQIYLKTNELEKAIEEGVRLIEEFPGEYQYQVDLARILTANGREEQAIGYLKQVLSDQPDNSESKLLLYEIYKRQGKEDQANDLLVSAFLDPSVNLDDKIRVLSGYLPRVSEPGMEELILKLGNQLVEAHENESRAHAYYGDILLGLKKNEKALESYIRSMELDDSNFNVWQNILSLEAQLNRMDKVIDHSEKAIELFPNQSSLFYYNGIGYLEKKDYETAIEAFKQGKRLSLSNPELKSLFNGLLGDAYNGTGQHRESDESYEEALNYDPDNWVILNNYSYYLSIRKDNLDKAKEMSQRLIKSNPDNPTYLDTYAWVLYALGEYKEAKSVMEKALQSPKDISAIHYEHYGDILYKLGDVEGAVKQWEIAKDLDSSLVNIDKKIADRKLYE